MLLIVHRKSLKSRASQDPQKCIIWQWHNTIYPQWIVFSVVKKKQKKNRISDLEWREKRCILKFIRFCVDMGLSFFDLLSQSWSCVPSCRQWKYKERGRLITRSLVSEKKEAVCKERGANSRWLLGFQISQGTECACVTPALLRSHRAATSSVFTLRWDEKSTYCEKWLAKFQSVFHATHSVTVFLPG